MTESVQGPERLSPEQPRLMPVQTHRIWRERAVVRESVYLRAYEVYCHVNGPQVEMVTGGCRGGFSSSELVAFLYAHSFPKDEWRTRTDEAFEGMTI